MEKTTIRKLAEIAKGYLDKGDSKLVYNGDGYINELAAEFHIFDYVPSDDKERMKVVYMQLWYCTDTFVGTKYFFLDGEFVAMSNKEGRKMDAEVFFVDDESAIKVKKYILELLGDDSPPVMVIGKCIDEEIDSTYKIEYSSQIIHDTAYLNGVKVSIIDKNGGMAESEVTIRYSNGNTEVLDCRYLDFKYGEEI